MDVCISRLDRSLRYKLLVGAVVPRPVAWVTTQTMTGVVNAAPYSAFTIASVTPPMLLINCSRRNGMEKDTARNILATREFVINIATEAQIEAMHKCSAELGPEASEPELFDIRLAPSRSIAPPRIAECPIAFECRMERVIEVGDERNQLFIGEVVHAHVDDAIMAEGKIDQMKLKPLGRIGGPTYAALGKLFHRPAP